MARKFLTALDLAKNELQNAAVQSLGSAPSAPVKFQLYGNSSDNTLYWWDGTTWVAAKAGGAIAFGSVPAETTFGLARADGVASTAARSDHTHGSPTHTNADHAAINLSALAAPTADISMGNFKITSLAAPVGTTDATNKAYVDNAIQGLDAKQSVRCASTAAGILTSFGTIIDGVTLVSGDRVLIKNQSAPAENGIYVSNGTANLAAGGRASDMDTWTEVPAAYVWVEQGTTNADTGWVCTSDPAGTLGTTAITWVQFSGAGSVIAGAGMTQSGNTLNVIGGTGITVAADLVSLDTTYTDGQYFNITGDTVTGVSAFNNSVTFQGGTTYNAYANFVSEAGSGTLPSTGTRYTNKTYVDGKTYAVNCSAGTSTVVNHTHNTRDVVVNVYRMTTPWDSVECDVERTDVNNVTVRFTTAPAAGDYRIVVSA